MSSDQRLSEYVAGLSAALFALIDALDKKSVLTFEDYRANLVRVRDQMSKDEMGDGIEFAFEQLIDLLNGAVAKRNR